MPSRPTRLLAAAIAASALLAGACGAGTTPTVATGVSTTTTAATADTAPTGAAAGASSSTTKVDANTASVAAMTSAFTRAGVGNAARWAREVEEYRPYPTDDPTFAKLRQNLAKYNPGDAVVDGIISALSL